MRKHLRKHNGHTHLGIPNDELAKVEHHHRVKAFFLIRFNVKMMPRYYGVMNDTIHIAANPGTMELTITKRPHPAPPARMSQRTKGNIQASAIIVLNSNRIPRDFFNVGAGQRL